MAVLLRLLSRPQILLLLVGVIVLAVYLVRRQVLQAQKGRGQMLIMPYCPKCESNRHVAANSGTDPRYPQGRSSWYCQDCKEGF
jgi:transposase-like protein